MPAGRNDRNRTNTFWTIVVAIETVILQIFDDKRVFVFAAVFIAAALVWEASWRFRRNKRLKGVLRRHAQRCRRNTPEQAADILGDAGSEEECRKREQYFKGLLTAGVIDRAEYHDLVAELRPKSNV